MHKLSNKCYFKRCIAQWTEKYVSNSENMSLCRSYKGLSLDTCIRALIEKVNVFNEPHYVRQIYHMNKSQLNAGSAMLQTRICTLIMYSLGWIETRHMLF